jgi:hypothetical protein
MTEETIKNYELTRQWREALLKLAVEQGHSLMEAGTVLLNEAAKREGPPLPIYPGREFPIDEPPR